MKEWDYERPPEHQSKRLHFYSYKCLKIYIVLSRGGVGSTVSDSDHALGVPKGKICQ